MITKEQIYNATDHGLRILELHIHGAAEAARSKKPVKLREERTASAYIKLQRLRNGSEVYGVTDFGESDKMIMPIALHMERAGLSFPEAILDLASIFNVHDHLDRSVNKPDFRQEPAPPDRADGEEFFELLDEFTEGMCKVMGPNVTPEHLKALHWQPVKFFAWVKDRKVSYRYSNDRYPIFMRECWYTNAAGKPECFYKVYEPMNPDKGYRFRYTPKGKKQPDYINGLWELREAYLKYNDTLEADWDRDPANEGKPYREQKLPEAFICSGERDSLCCRSHGYWPLWLNSETAELKEEAYREISKYVETIYNIPDVDTTGIRKGREMALRHLDIHTIWLPSDYLSKYRDNRGNPRKDLRDWMELKPNRRDFEKLKAIAKPAKFWETYIETNQKTGRIKVKYSLDVVCLRYFLGLNGISLYQVDSNSVPFLIRRTNSIVERITARQVREFVFLWAEGEGLDRKLLNIILNTPFLSESALETLPVVDLDFTNYTAQSQLFFFRDCAIEVTAEGMQKTDFKNGKSSRNVWKENIIDHGSTILPDMFRITYTGENPSSEDFDIEVLDNRSTLFRVLINSSRLYWRDELEYKLAGLPIEQAAAYRQTHHFDIAGPNLTPKQIREQKRCLINKIFIIGYMMHRYKDRSKSWAPYVMDNVIGENDQCNGGSGKSFMFFALSNFCNMDFFNGRNEKLFNNQFWMERITKQTHFALFDDLHEYFPLKEMYNTISGDLEVNRKNVTSQRMKFEDAPKFAFTTNYVPKEFNGSTIRRALFCVMSDYYHAQSPETDYLESRTIASDFGKSPYSEAYTEDEWVADINFIMQCVRFYLSIKHLDVKLEPDISNIIYRKNMRDMSDNFRDWAEQYFAPGGDHLDDLIVRQEAFDDYRRFSGATKTTMQGFTKSLKAFCFVSDYIDELNPADLCNSGNRILKRIDFENGQRKQVDMIYLRTVKEADKLNREKQTELPF